MSNYNRFFFNKSKKLSFFQVYTYRKYFWHFWILDRDLGGHPILRIQIHITWMKFYYCTLLNENLLLSSLLFFRKGNLKTVDLQQFYQNIFENLFFKFLKTKIFFYSQNFSMTILLKLKKDTKVGTNFYRIWSRIRNP